jgi:hypothetical protein
MVVNMLRCKGCGECGCNIECFPLKADGTRSYVRCESKERVNIEVDTMVGWQNFVSGLRGSR